MYESSLMMMGGKSLKRVRSDSMDSRGSSPRRESDGVYTRGHELTVEEKKARIVLEKMENMNEEQLERFEFFRRSHFDKDVIKKHMVDAFATIKAGLADGLRDEVRNKAVDVDERMVMIMGTLAKMFVGDIVRDGAGVRNQRGEEGALCPRHIREAYRRAVKNKQLPLLRGKTITDLGP